MTIKFNEQELQLIKENHELCIAVARDAMERNKLTFDDIENINNHYEEHRWGSNADRKYRKSALNKAVAKVAANPMKFM